MDVQKATVGMLKENTYVLTIGNECLLIDPGSDAPEDLAAIKELIGEKKLLAVLCTHNHFDHIGALHCFTDVSQYMHTLDILTMQVMALRAQQHYGVDLTLPSKPLKELGTTVEIGPFHAEVLHTPGHSPGSVCFWFKEQNLLISGDTLFVGTHGRVDLPGSSPQAMKQSLARLTQLPESTHFYPGHGWDGEIKNEKSWMQKLL